jgi:thiosulfate dehydrogenase
MKRTYLRGSLAILIVLVVTAGGQIPQPVGAQARPPAQTVPAAPSKETPPASLPVAKTWIPPNLSKIPSGPRGESIRLGFHIFQETPRYAAKYVGNQISCGNCHIQVGTMTNALPLVGAPSWFPHFSQRAQRMITLQDRIQECMTRSESGAPLPEDGPEMRALLDFFAWLSESHPAEHPAPVRGLPALPENLQADLTRGEKIFTDKCAGCHGADGAGVPPILPPLWGPGAYNDGAGMNQPAKMAAFIVNNMPQNKPGTLTPQEAFDVASYIASKPHSPYNHAYDIY